MGLINWIFDFYQQYRIDELRKETAQAAAVRGATGSLDAERLEHAIGELALAVRTVQRMLIEKGVCTQQELHDKLRAIDLEDGRADGRARLT
jgi:hypothetical protein